MADDSDGDCPGLMSLADELVEYIIILTTLSYRDVCMLSKTCRRMNNIANGKEIWKAKAEQRWKIWKYNVAVDNDWKAIFKSRLKCENDIRKLIDDLVKRSYKKDCLQNMDLVVFANYFDAQSSEILGQIENVFESLLQTSRFKDLTTKFYAREIYIFIRQHQLKREWSSFLTKPDGKNKLLEGAILISQWCNPLKTIKKDRIMKVLDDIVARVKDRVAEKSDLKASFESNNLEVLEAIRHILYEEICFRGNSRSYYDVNNSFIDKVLELKTGIPITLSIVHASVAEKLGIDLEPVNFPTHFLLRYPANRSNHHNNHKYIDAFHGGKIMEENDCLQILPFESRNSVPGRTLFPTASSKQVFIRMVANIVNTHRSSTNIDARSLDKLRGALELMLLLDPDDEDHLLMLSRIYLHHGINLNEVVDNLRRLTASTRGNLQTGLLATLLEYAVERQDEEDEEQSIKAKYRSDPQNSEVVYRIGMVMHHRRYHYFCVIYGWDYFCNMEEAWRNQMGVYNLSCGAEQPFYNVLADDGSTRYASQENLAPLLKDGRPVNHSSIGKYFEEFNGFHYIPNCQLAEAYPEDGNIPTELLPANRFEGMDNKEHISLEDQF